MTIIHKITYMAIAAVLLSGCAVKRDITDKDVAAITAQSNAKVACYNAKAASKPDVSGMSATERHLSLAIEKLGEANRLFAGKDIDECANAGGTNVYDLAKKESDDATKQIDAFWGFGGKFINAAEIVALGLEFKDLVKSLMDGAGNKVIGNGNNLEGVFGKNTGTTYNKSTQTISDSIFGDSALPK